jgi:hypothetical protein
MSMADAFAGIATAFSRAGIGPYRDAQACWPGVPVTDEGGSIVEPGVPIVHPCQVQVDSASEAMRAEAGFRDTDVALVILASTLAVSMDTDAEIVRDGLTYSVQSAALDSMATHWICRGRKL